MSILVLDRAAAGGRRWVRIAGGAVVLLVGVVALPRLRPLPVEVALVTRGRAVSAVYATGTLEAASRRVVRARTAGVLEPLVKEGQMVHAGELLARIDPGALAADVRRGRVELRAAMDSSGPSAPRLSALRSDAQSIEADREVAARELARTEKLFQQSSAAQSELDRARARKEQLDARLDAKRAELRAAEIDLSSSALRSRAQLDALLARMEDTEVRAAIDGVVLRRAVEPGEVVAKDALLFRLGDPQALLVEAYIDEADAAGVRARSDGDPGSKVGVRFYARPDEVVAGRVVEIAPEADRDKRSLLVKVRLERLPQSLRVGMSAELNIVTGEAERVLVAPTAALEGDQVWVMREGRALRVKVERGLSDLDRTEIRAGLHEGETVIIGGATGLTDGKRVKVR